MRKTGSRKSNNFQTYVFLMFFMTYDSCNKSIKIGNSGGENGGTIEPWPIGVILGGLLRIPIFDKISIGRKCTKIQKMGAKVF